MSTDEELINKAVEAYIKGNGLEAEALYLEAAKNGSGHAAHNLGVLYATGAPGVVPDSEKSQYWLNFALESGFEETVASDPEWFKPKI